MLDSSLFRAEPRLNVLTIKKRKEVGEGYAYFFFFTRTTTKETTANAAATPIPMTAHGTSAPAPLRWSVGGLVGGTVGG